MGKTCNVADGEINTMTNEFTPAHIIVICQNIELCDFAGSMRIVIGAFE